MFCIKGVKLNKNGFVEELEPKIYTTKLIVFFKEEKQVFCIKGAKSNKIGLVGELDPV